MSARGVIVTRVRLADLEMDPANPRLHGDRNLAEIEASLRAHGQVEPLVVQRSRMRLIGGNGRVEVMKRLGWTEADANVIDCSDAEARALSVRLNRTADLAEWSAEGLAAAFDELKDSDWSFDSLGFTGDELAAWSAPEPEPPARPVVPAGDDVPEPPAVPVSRLGEVYELGPHRLVCGDSTKPETWAALLRGEKVQMVWTDPPYGVSIVGGDKNPTRPSHQSGHRIDNDDLNPEQLRELLQSSLGLCSDACRSGASWYVAAPPGPLNLIFGSVLSALSVWRQTLIWKKHAFVFGRSDYHYIHEPIFYGWKPGAGHHFIDDRTQSSVLEYDRPSGSDKLHPTVKPIGLVKKCIENSTHPGWVVADPFGGSGTTLMACAELERVARVIEIDPRCSDVIRKRWTRWAVENQRDPGPGALY